LSRLIAFLANDPDRVRCVLHAGRGQLSADVATADGWGIGFYQGGEVLLQRRPKRPTAPVDFYAIAGELRTDVLIGHVRSATVGAVKNENTHPFRFRSWLLAHHGTIANFEAVREALRAEIPDFLRRNIRGETDSEHLFHLFLGFLHESGRLDDPLLPPKLAREALQNALAVVERLAGPGGSEVDLAVTNGRLLLATRVGGPVAFYRVSGVRDCPVCRESPDAGREPKRIDHEHLRGFVLVADAPSPAAPWEQVPDRSIITVSHELQAEITSL
jgi:predicted glutamine amidotransferase